MVLKPEPIFEAVESLVGSQAPLHAPQTAVVLLSAAGRLFGEETARRFARLERMVLICGRYEGVDERVAEHLATDEISIGDFVLSGGELPAAMILDAVTRLIPGALGNQDSAANESFSVSWSEAGRGAKGAKARDRNAAEASHASVRPADRFSGILDYPHYTRPQTFRGWEVPPVLMGGNHQEIRRWRRKRALEKTRSNRPDLLRTIDSGR
jgi:tRNA (guanine37-N1)-methyltransferase